MGLQKPKRGIVSLLSKAHSDTNSLQLLNIESRESSQGVFYSNAAASLASNMAPALTEPISPSNKLSTASASPRPTASNSPLQNNANSINTNHTHINNSVRGGVLILEENRSNSRTNSVYNNSNYKDKYPRNDVNRSTTANTKGAFQIAFEKSIAQRSPTVTVSGGSSIATNNFQMGPMCESKTVKTPNIAPLIKYKSLQSSNTESTSTHSEHLSEDIEDIITTEVCVKFNSKLTESQLTKPGGARNTDNSAVVKSKDHMDACHKTELSSNDMETVNKENIGKTVECKKTKINNMPPDESAITKTDSTVTASEDDQDRSKVNHASNSPAISLRSPPGQNWNPQTPTGSTGTKDYKDNPSEMDHDIEDDLLQVLKGFDTTSGGDICDLAGFLSDYGMNYEDVNLPNVKDNQLSDAQIEIQRNQHAAQRKIDFLSRRLRKLQARHMCKQASEEISGLFEFSARTTSRKSTDDGQFPIPGNKYNAVSMATMRNLVKKINVASSVQQSALEKTPSYSYHMDTPIQTPTPEIVIPTFNDKVSDEIIHTSGMLQTEMREVLNAIDSDATASSSGGESADELLSYNNQLQETLPIAKRAAWRYSCERASIAARWAWLHSQITDLEIKIQQCTELQQQLRQQKGKVLLINESRTSTSSVTKPSSSPSVNGPPESASATDGVDSDSLKGSEYGTADETVTDLNSELLDGACRTRAFQASVFKKRKLFQTANVHIISKKIAKPSTIKCGCQWPLYPCALCTGRPDPTAPRDLPDTMTLHQRVELLDPSFHQNLSFSKDIPSSACLEVVASDPNWQNRVVRTTAKSAMKGALAMQRAAEKIEYTMQSAPSTSGKERLKNITANPVKRKYTKRIHQDIHGGDSLKTTPLVANRSRKRMRKYQHSSDYNHNSHLQMRAYKRNAVLSSRRLVHSSSIPQSLKNKIRKCISSTPAAGVATASTTLNNSGGQKLNNIHHIKSEHQGHNNEFKFLNSESLDGVTPNGLVRSADRSRTSSPMHGVFQHKHDRSLERKNRTSYDIDNIVIPYSVAAATRVEILPYKEIPTPKWRIIDYSTDEPTLETKSQIKRESAVRKVKVEKLNNVSTTKKGNITTSNSEPSSPTISNQCDEEDDLENISDETMTQRHERALVRERRKFQTYMKFPWSTRSRANQRFISRADSSGQNTPDSPSPAPLNSTNNGGDQDYPPLQGLLPLFSPLDTISDSSDNSNGVLNPAMFSVNKASSLQTESSCFSKNHCTRRASFVKKDDNRRSLSPDPREQITPYEPLVFPLSNDLFNSMLS